MSFFEFPNTRTYDNDLGWLIEHVKGVEEKVETFIAFNKITYADPFQWNITSQYAANTVTVDSNGTAYISTKPVPAGIELSNTDYWTPIFNYAGGLDELREWVTEQIEEMRRELTEAGVYVTPEFFGAAGDGVQDDTVYVDDCLKSGLPIRGKTGSVYAVSAGTLEQPSTLETDEFPNEYTYFLYLYHDNTDIDNLHLKDINPSGDNKYFSVFANASGHVGIDGLHLNNCIFDFGGLTDTQEVYNRRILLRSGTKTDNVVIENCTFLYSGSACVFLRKCTNVEVSNNYFEYNGGNIDNNGCIVQGIYNTSVTENTFTSIAVTGVWQSGTRHYAYCGLEIETYGDGFTTASGNNFVNCYTGINVTAEYPVEQTDAGRVMISNNSFLNNCMDIGLWATNTDDPTDNFTLRNVTIQGNHSYKQQITVQALAAARFEWGFVVSRGERVSGVRVYGNFKNITIRNNTVTAAHASEAGIAFYERNCIFFRFGTAENIIIAENIIDGYPVPIAKFGTANDQHCYFEFVGNIVKFWGATGTPVGNFAGVMIKILATMDRTPVINGNLFEYLGEGFVTGIVRDGTFIYEPESYFGKNSYRNMYSYEYVAGELAVNPSSGVYWTNDMRTTASRIEVCVTPGKSAGDTATVAANKLVTAPLNVYKDSVTNVHFIPVVPNNACGAILSGGGTITASQNPGSVAPVFRGVNIT